MERVDVAIIGAGPYGLSLAAFLRARGIEHRIFGDPMESWRDRMPPGMQLKSDGWSSSLYDPESELTIGEFCRREHLTYDDSQIPVPLETFIAYGMAFQKRFAPQVQRKQLVALSGSRDDFLLRFDDGSEISAANVVLGVGVHPFKFVPAPLSGLPADRVTHSGDHGPIAQLKGKHVAVVGSGASAIDLAGLLHEQGTDVALVARAPKLHFGTRSREKRSFFSQLRRPSSGIGGTWTLKICADTPEIVHALPRPMRLHLVKNELGPSGGWFMRDRIMGHVPLELGQDVAEARARNGKIELTLRSAEGREKTLSADHVIAATGYRIDIRRYDFLDRKLLSAIRVIEQAPQLSQNYETSVPGLYVIGPATANSFGPVARFVFGAIHPARRISLHLDSRAAARAPAMQAAKAG